MNTTKNLAHSPPYQLETEAQLEELTNIFTDSCARTLKSACPKQKLKVKHKPPWWSKALSKQKRECRTAFNNAKRLGVDSAWEVYNSVLNVYKTAIRKAKRLDWIRFCNEIESTSEASRL